MIRFAIYLFSLPFAISMALAQPKPLQTFEGCRFVPTEWADGDSFRIKTAKGDEMTIRLYVADCLERGELDGTDSRRLRDQRRHFGITDVKGDASDSVALAKKFGNQAKEFTERKLKQPFKLHTYLHKAPGDGKHERFYAFVETSDGKDLAMELIRAGLARASGRSKDTISNISEARYKQMLEDYEDQAGNRKKGVWKFTDWDKLPEERDIQRKEDEEDQAAAGETLPEDFRLNPNTASREELDRLPGIGEVLADAIIEARDELPFEEPKDLMRADGIKQKTLAKFERYLDFKEP